MKHYFRIDKSYLNMVGYDPGTNKPQYIVIHNTGQDNDTAEANVRYFVNLKKKIAAGDTSRFASTHYVLDESHVFQCAEHNKICWSVGGSKWNNKGGKLYGKCTNRNSISIEMANTTLHYNFKSIENMICLVKDLCRKTKIPYSNVIRHYDVNGKTCPYMLNEDSHSNGDYNWNLILKLIKTGDKYKVRILADGTCQKAIKKTSDWVKVGKLKL